jgi:Protein of unknown function (DUF2934)
MIKESIKNKNADSLLDEEFGRFVDLPDHDNTISELAYYKAQNRGFEAGHELDDWLEAERDLLF